MHYKLLITTIKKYSNNMPELAFLTRNKSAVIKYNA
jgi:hypothetical protein